jgi:hypothetical protein
LVSNTPVGIRCLNWTSGLIRLTIICSDAPRYWSMVTIKKTARCESDPKLMADSSGTVGVRCWQCLELTRGIFAVALGSARQWIHVSILSVLGSIGRPSINFTTCLFTQLLRGSCRSPGTPVSSAGPFSYFSSP